MARKIILFLLALTSFQYLVFTLIAVAGYITWKKEIIDVK